MTTHITDTERKLQTQVNLLTTTNEVLAERVKALEADSQPKQVTCQIYGHVVGACVECNTHLDSQVPDGWDEAVKSAQFFNESCGLIMKDYTQELAQAIIDMDAKIREVTP
jgi:hypothetical protein